MASSRWGSCWGCALDKGIFWAGIGGGGRIGGPAPRVAGPGMAGATVTGIVRAERPRGGGSAGVAGRVVRRAKAAGVWRESDGGVRCGARADSAGRFRCRLVQARAEVGAGRRSQPHSGPQIAVQQQAAQQRHALQGGNRQHQPTRAQRAPGSRRRVLCHFPPRATVLDVKFPVKGNGLRPRVSGL